MDGWLKRKDAAKYGGAVSLKTLSAWFEDGLRFIKPRKGPILTRRSWVDEYLEKFEVKDGNAQVDEIVDETLRGFRS